MSHITVKCTESKYGMGILLRKDHLSRRFTRESVISHVEKSFVTCEEVMSRVNESCHMGMSLLEIKNGHTHKVRLHESCHT